MSDTTRVAISSSPPQSVLGYFGFTPDKSIPVSILEKLLSLTSILKSNRIDDETAVAFMRSYEDKYGKLDDAHLRITKLNEFAKALDASGSRSGFIDNVKLAGMLSKNELEEQAKETGDWGAFLKRSSAEKVAPTLEEIA